MLVTTPHNPPRGSGGGYADLPARMVTLNQIAAYNMAYFRKAAGLSQEDLGQLLGGWSNAAVSAAERSWDGKRVRQFDADTLLLLAATLQIPIQALLLPPEDDGAAVRYVIDIGYAERPISMSMSNLFVHLAAELVSDHIVPCEDLTPAQAQFRDRYTAAVSHLTSEQVGEEIAEATGADRAALAAEVALTGRLDMLRTQRLALRSVLDDLDALHTVLDQRLADVRSEGRSPRPRSEGPA
jgi:transcriptional regulator with XRE-family HTH domain